MPHAWRLRGRLSRTAIDPCGVAVAPSSAKLTSSDELYAGREAKDPLAPQRAIAAAKSDASFAAEVLILAHMGRSDMEPAACIGPRAPPRLP
mmetsp:Transcript_158625/g.504855  ORF Transcript_158625/g.504855 Transcript_158625/m.504855 type:complete len:92 (+) Transcript_158625:886-1161(+)